jgi:16S rRNA C967 or C1407 C5-methylase (RsmB/RsmF family)
MDVTEAFLARNHNFRRLSAAETWSTAVGAPIPPGMRDNLTATPLKTGTDGFFVCIMVAG